MERKTMKPVRSESFEVYIDKMHHAAAIGWFCVDCSGGSANEARNCHMEGDCPLWHLRLGGLKARNKALVVKPERTAAQISHSQKQGEKLRDMGKNS